MLESANQLVEHLTKDVNELLKMKKELAMDAEDCLDRINIQKESVLEIFERKTDAARTGQQSEYAVGMPLALTQEDFLVCMKLWGQQVPTVTRNIYNMKTFKGSRLLMLSV